MSDFKSLIDMFKQFGGSGSSSNMNVAAITINRGTYIQVGSEQLYLKSNLTINPDADQDTIMKAVEAAVELRKESIPQMSSSCM